VIYLNLTFFTTLAAENIDSGAIQAVSSSDFSNSINAVIQFIYNSLYPIVLPIAKLALLISALVFILGAIVMSKEIKKAGWYGVVTTVAVIFFFYLAPLILRFIVTAAKTAGAGR
jgi:magnesium-transporting ATPase (P-type)